MQLCLLDLNLAFLFSYLFSAAATICQRECGSTSVPYPFGLGDSSECYKDSTYKLFCNETSNPPLLSLLKLPIYNISTQDGTAIVDIFLAFNCYYETGKANTYDQSITLRGKPFTFSSTVNKFTALGCNSVALISDGSQTGRFASGCLPMCGDENTTVYDLEPLTNQPLQCSGDACCQTPIPQGLKSLDITLSILSNQSGPNTCSYGFLAGTNYTLGMTPEKFPYSAVTLDWAVGEMTCEQARRNGREYICGDNTDCLNSANGPGYHCSCKEGFKGNPYERKGCIDIDECSPEYGELYPCKGTCKNKPGNYTCSCSFGYQGDGKEGCNMKMSTKVLIAIGAFAFVAALVLSLHWWYKRKIQEMNHIRNGGLLLGQFSVTSFKASQLEKATNGFDSKRLLGEGGNGWVYRGSADNIEIAVKKSKVVDQNQIEQFLNEADIVSKINHKNVVKLLGVCLDSKVPMLVYEFVPNGTLYQHLHGTKSRILDSWRICLRVAAETARALDYMHSQAYPPIIHRDVKSSNILLDGTYTAKVADFGASKLIRLDQTMAHTQGQGTMGYLDPEYLQTGELTTMSDVYSYGVVLMELLSKQKPITRGISGEMIGLVKVFTSAIENNCFDQAVRVTDVSEHETEQVHLVANLAIRCVAMPSKNRPTMTEVADLLNSLCKVYSSFPVEGSCDEVVGLLDDQDVMTTSVHFELDYSSNV